MVRVPVHVRVFTKPKAWDSPVSCAFVLTQHLSGALCFIGWWCEGGWEKAEHGAGGEQRGCF